MINKNILFLLPHSGNIPSGGFKVVYEYANRLAKDGYDVSIVYPAYCFNFNQSLFQIIKSKYYATKVWLRHLILNNYSCKNWFNLDSRVKEYWVWSLKRCFVRKSDIYIATAVQTAVYLNQYKNVPNDNKYYLIQHYENWSGATKQDVENTYSFAMNKIVIAKWLKNIVNDLGENCTLIPNGFDFVYFNIYKQIHLRNKYVICMLYHRAEWKGCSDGFKALDIVKKKYPQLQVNIFGVTPRPIDLPDWYYYFQKPDRETHNKLYNESAIFIGPSWSEGWGLTIGEAMICGCAVACTDNSGYLEMAIDDKTALVSPVKDVKALANNVIRLIEDDVLRFRIAESGNQSIKQFTWESSFEKLKKVITD